MRVHGHSRHASKVPQHSPFLGGKGGDSTRVIRDNALADMANNIWEESGDKIVQLFKNEPELEHFSFTIVGHSLGAGTACLMNVKCHAEKLLGEERHVRCYGFTPPPTLYTSTDSEASLSIQKAIDHTICYVHDNDCVPFLSVSAVHRLVGRDAGAVSFSFRSVRIGNWILYHATSRSLNF